jgi:hypothetical protein
MGTQNGEHATRGGDWEPGRWTSGLVLRRAAAFAGSTPYRVPLNLFMEVGDPSFGDLVVEGRVHRGLPVP